jgi:hypothetical protein
VRDGCVCGIGAIGNCVDQQPGGDDTPVERAWFRAHPFAGLSETDTVRFRIAFLQSSRTVAPTTPVDARAVGRATTKRCDWAQHPAQ